MFLGFPRSPRPRIGGGGGGFFIFKKKKKKKKFFFGSPNPPEGKVGGGGGFFLSSKIKVHKFGFFPFGHKKILVAWFSKLGRKRLETRPGRAGERRKRVGESRESNFSP